MAVRGPLSSSVRQQPCARLLLELPILGRPVRVDRRVEDPLQLGARLGVAIQLEQRLGEEEVRRRAVRRRRSATCAGAPPTSCLLPPKRPGTLKYQRPSARSAEPCWKAGSSFSTVSSSSLIVAAVLEALPQAERLGERAHVGRDPEVALGTIGFERGRGLRRPRCRPREAASRSAVRRVPAEPVARPRQLPRRLEIPRRPAQPVLPDRCRARARWRGLHAARTAHRDRRPGAAAPRRPAPMRRQPERGRWTR